MGSGERSMRILLISLLLVGCTSPNYKPNNWHYKGPDYVDCTYDKRLLEVCEKAGPYWVCECKYT